MKAGLKSIQRQHVWPFEGRKMNAKGCFRLSFDGVHRGVEDLAGSGHSRNPASVAQAAFAFHLMCLSAGENQIHPHAFKRKLLDIWALPRAKARLFPEILERIFKYFNMFLHCSVSFFPKSARNKCIWYCLTTQNFTLLNTIKPNCFVLVSWGRGVIASIYGEESMLPSLLTLKSLRCSCSWADGSNSHPQNPGKMNCSKWGQGRIQWTLGLGDQSALPNPLAPG